MSEPPQQPIATSASNQSSNTPDSAAAVTVPVPGPTWLVSLKVILALSWLNILFLGFPAAWALRFFSDDASSKRDVAIFVFGYISILPLSASSWHQSKVLGFVTEQLALRLGQQLGGLFSAMTENLVEFAIAVLALKKCELSLVQSSLLATILRNLLLVPGLCFFAHGIRFMEGAFDTQLVRQFSSLLTLNVCALLLPAGFNFVLSRARVGMPVDKLFAIGKEGHDILRMSRVVAAVLLLIFVISTLAKFWSCDSVRVDNAGEVKSTAYPKNPKHTKGHGAKPLPTPTRTDGDLERSHGDPIVVHKEPPKLNCGAAVLALVVVTILISLTAEIMVSSVDKTTDRLHLPHEWAGIMLVPVARQVMDQVTTPVANKLTLSLSIAMGSSVEIVLFILPLLITISWIMGKPLSLLFDPAQSVALFIAVISLNTAVADGKANWFKGLMLLCLYVVAAFVLWFNPSDTSVRLQAMGLVCPA